MCHIQITFTLFSLEYSMQGNVNIKFLCLKNWNYHLSLSLSWFHTSFTSKNQTLKQKLCNKALKDLLMYQNKKTSAQFLYLLGNEDTLLIASICDKKWLRPTSDISISTCSQISWKMHYKTYLSRSLGQDIRLLHLTTFSLHQIDLKRSGFIIWYIVKKIYVPYSRYMLLFFNSEFHCGTKLTVHKIYFSKSYCGTRVTVEQSQQYHCRAIVSLTMKQS